jgi:TolA-binding protein
MNLSRSFRLSLVLAAVAACAGCGSIARWLEGEPKSIRQWHSARDLFEDERYAQAAVAFRAWLADYHDADDLLRPTVMYKLGECYRLTRDYERAIRTYRRTVQLYADSPHESVRKLVGLARQRLEDILPSTPHRHEPDKPKKGSGKAG